MKVNSVNKSRKVDSYSYKNSKRKNKNNSNENNVTFRRLFQEELEKSDIQEDKNSTK